MGDGILLVPFSKVFVPTRGYFHSHPDLILAFHIDMEMLRRPTR